MCGAIRKLQDDVFVLEAPFQRLDIRATVLGDALRRRAGQGFGFALVCPGYAQQQPVFAGAG
jgi:hypothetical protein